MTYKSIYPKIKDIVYKKNTFSLNIALFFKDFVWDLGVLDHLLIREDWACALGDAVMTVFWISKMWTLFMILSKQDDQRDLKKKIWFYTKPWIMLFYTIFRGIFMTIKFILCQVFK